MYMLSVFYIALSTSTSINHFELFKSVGVGNMSLVILFTWENDSDILLLRNITLLHSHSLSWLISSIKFN